MQNGWAIGGCPGEIEGPPRNDTETRGAEQEQGIKGCSKSSRSRRIIEQPHFAAARVTTWLRLRRDQQSCSPPLARHMTTSSQRPFSTSASTHPSKTPQPSPLSHFLIAVSSDLLVTTIEAFVGLSLGRLAACLDFDPRRVRLPPAARRSRSGFDLQRPSSTSPLPPSHQQPL